MTKKELRDIYKQKRSQVSERDMLRWDDLLMIHFQQIDLSGIRTVMSYLPMEKQAEPDTEPISGYLRHMLPEIQIAYPVSDWNSVSMQAVTVNEDSVYHTNSKGITEPKEGEVLAAESIDLILVPLLIFDRKGYRVGYGKGFYDRFLTKCRKNVITIGLSYFDPVDSITDTDQFDVPLTYCITPQLIYEF